MRSALLTLCLAFGMSASAQEVLYKDSVFQDFESRLILEEVFEVEGKTAEELQLSFRNWVNVTYNNPDAVIVGTTSNSITMNPVAVGIGFRVEALFKDGKYKLKITERATTIITSNGPRTITASHYFYLLVGGRYANGLMNKGAGWVVDKETDVWKNKSYYQKLNSFFGQIEGQVNDIHEALISESVTEKQDW